MSESERKQSAEPRFFFNGIELSALGTRWNLVDLGPAVLKLPAEDVTISDVWSVACRIDHVGRVESCDSDVFVYAVNEIVLRAVAQKEEIIEVLADDFGREHAEKGYVGFVKGNLAMRQIALESGRAFWSSGAEADAERVREAMQRGSLARYDADYQDPPHIRNRADYARFLQSQQWKKFAAILTDKRVKGEIREELERALRIGNSAASA